MFGIDSVAPARVAEFKDIILSLLLSAEAAKQHEIIRIICKEMLASSSSLIVKLSR